MLKFKPVELQDYELVYKYMSEYGEGSSQHSFVSMYSLSEKYMDSICEKDGFLYTQRAGLGDDQYRVYLVPMGSGDIREAFLNVFKDAQQYGKKAKFISITEKYVDFLKKEFPCEFIIEEDRNLFEYIYETESMSGFYGPGLSKRRQQLRKFWNEYGDRAVVKKIDKNDYEDIINYEMKWLKDNSEDHDRFALEREARMIKKQIKEFDALGLSGVVLRVEGKVRGFGYGVGINNDYYDAIIEKADRDIEFAYRVLRAESVKQCAMKYKYVNMEEDVGEMGLRKLKESYKPAFMIKKYIATKR